MKCEMYYFRNYILSDIIIFHIISADIKRHLTISSSICLQAVRVTSGDHIAVIGANAKMGLSVTLSQEPVSALMGTRGGVVRSPANMVTMAKHVSSPASVSMVPPATTKQESVSVHPATQGLCEYQ